MDTLAQRRGPMDARALLVLLARALAQAPRRASNALWTYLRFSETQMRTRNAI